MRKVMREAPGIWDHQHLDEALDQVLEQDPQDRVRFITDRFQANPVLVDQLLELVRASEGGERFLSSANEAAYRLWDLDDASETRAGPPTPPSEIGAYRILDLLGSGGMGTVYLAERREGGVDRKVALKVVTGAAHRPELRRRFIAEQRILSRMEHPNVARLYDIGFDQVGAPFFVMEHIDGVPITTYADERRLSAGERLALIRQVADALAYAHRNLVVHRDVKPSNILVTSDGVVKLLDFGVAKLLDDGPADSGGALTRADAPLLTPEYASPEQIRGDPVTTGTDVYATGVLLYELLTGSRPYEFTSRAPAHIERVVTGQDPRPPSLVAAAMSAEEAAVRSTTPARLSRRLEGDLDAILLTALRKEPELRYGSSQELAADIDRHSRREPILARSPTWRYRGSRFVARHRAGVAAASLVALALAAGLAATTWQARIASQQADRAERVKNLLVDVFEGSDPDVAAGSTLTAVELLARGEEALLAGLGDEPEIQAELQQIVGTIYTSLGEYDRAAPLLESSVRLRDRHSGPAERAAARAALADLRYATSDFADGERIARELLDLRRATHPEASVEYAAALTDLASFVKNQGRYDEAEGILRDALEIDRSVGTPGSVAIDLNNLGALLTSQARYEEAIASLEESLAIRQQQHPEGHTDVATSMANLALALDKRGDFERADSLYEATLAMRRRLLGEEHALVAMVLNNQATMRQTEGRLEESRKLHGEALRVRRAVFGDDHAVVAASLNNLAIVSYYERDYESAAQTFREALRIFRLHHDEDHPHVLTGVGNLGAVLRAQGKLDEAEVLVRSTLETRIRVLGPDHHNTGGSWNNLGIILRLQGRYAEAEEPIRNAVEIFRAALDPNHPDLADARLNMGRTLVAMGRGDEWVEELRESCASTATRRAPDHPTLAGCRSVLGLALLDAGMRDEAIVELSEAIEVLEDARAEDPWTTRAREALDGMSGF
jgi:serine/threonine-protein kinase